MLFNNMDGNSISFMIDNLLSRYVCHFSVIQLTNLVQVATVIVYSHCNKPPTSEFQKL